MVNDFGEAIAAFVAMPETRQIAQPKQIPQISTAGQYTRERAAPYRKIDLQLNSLFV